MLLALLEKHPTARGILFDSPRVIAEARDATQNFPHKHRLTLTPGDFFVAVPQGDIFLFSPPSSTCSRILKRSAS